MPPGLDGPGRHPAGKTFTDPSQAQAGATSQVVTDSPAGQVQVCGHIIRSTTRMCTRISCTENLRIGQP
eukprot:g35720.t1